jgi:hypothetical protein
MEMASDETGGSMDTADGASREIAFPVSVFGSLRAALEKEAGTLPTVHALHHAGYMAGVSASDSVAGDGTDPGSLAQDAFWARLSDFCSRRGWGSLQHEQRHPAVGMLSSTDWAEATGGDTGPDASCHFSTGYLSGILSQLAGGPVAVLEVACRARGSDRCRFAFGSESAIHELYGRLLDADDLDDALSAL